MSTLKDALVQVERNLRAGQVAEAMQVAHAAVMRGQVHPGLLTLAAQQEAKAGRMEPALAFAERAVALAPTDADALRTKAMALSGLGRKLEAIRAYENTLRLTPNMASVHYDLGLLYQEHLEQAFARAAFENTVALRPTHAGALGELAAMAKTRGDAEAARSYAERALRARPDHAGARIVLAELALDAGDGAEARTQLDALLAEPGLSAVNRSIVLGLLADLADSEQRHADAFAGYAESNALLKQRYRATYDAPGVERAVVRAQRLARFLRDAPEARWRDCPAGTYLAPVTSHVLLMGFPRSGTTLLEQIIAGHSAIETLEERGCFSLAMTELLEPLDGMARLETLGDDALAHYRDAYWNEARDADAKLGRVFVDKMPLNILNLALAAKLFPEAKVILALRDPRDVVLSCFRRRFRMSANMYELLDLADAARFYDAVMDLAEVARAKLTLPVFETRYEDLVEDTEGRARALCDFLGLAFEPGMLDFTRTAATRAIATPSGKQVARGLYSGEGQWRAYAEQMEGVLPVLAPWVARYGYA